VPCFKKALGERAAGPRPWVSADARLLPQLKVQRSRDGASRAVAFDPMRKVRAHAQQARNWPFCATISYRSYFLK
jgi:hypothetical protein